MNKLKIIDTVYNEPDYFSTFWVCVLRVTNDVATQYYELYANAKDAVAGVWSHRMSKTCRTLEVSYYVKNRWRADYPSKDYITNLCNVRSYLTDEEAEQVIFKQQEEAANLPSNDFPF